MIFFTAFLTGLLGSFHCVGMCGPIALVTPQVGNSMWQKVIGKVIYNLGRIITYSILGGVIGYFGFGLKLAGLQQSISLFCGVFIMVFVGIKFIKPQWLNGNGLGINTGKILGKLLTQKNYTSLLSIGLLNGLLPCGFVYIALVGSLATQSAKDGALFMALFGLGTFPLMFMVGLLGQFITLNTRQKVNKAMPFLALFIGALFVLRGLNLGIPYISPKLNQQQTQVEDCCKPEVR